MWRGKTWKGNWPSDCVAVWNVVLQTWKGFIRFPQFGFQLLKQTKVRGHHPAPVFVSWTDYKMYTKVTMKWLHTHEDWELTDVCLFCLQMFCSLEQLTGRSWSWLVEEFTRWRDSEDCPVVRKLTPRFSSVYCKLQVSLVLQFSVISGLVWLCRIKFKIQLSCI